jgi:hypothetical protein
MTARRKAEKGEKPEKAEVKDMAADLAAEALGVLATLMRDGNSEPVRVAAAREVLDRAHGKPKTEAPGGAGPTFEQMVDHSYRPEEA